jgi:hypothetical protein
MKNPVVATPAANPPSGGGGCFALRARRSWRALGTSHTLGTRHALRPGSTFATLRALRAHRTRIALGARRTSLALGTCWPWLALRPYRTSLAPGTRRASVALRSGGPFLEYELRRLGLQHSNALLQQLHRINRRRQ